MKKIIVLLFCSYFLFSCNKENESFSNNDSKLRNQFMKGKSIEEVKSDYNLLKAKEKVALWNEKLNQILKTELEQDVKVLIENLKFELNQEHVDLKKIRNIGSQLANNLSNEQFDDMFLKLDDYKVKNNAKNPVSEEIKLQLKNNKMLINDGMQNNLNLTSRKFAIDCSCNWTCSSFCSNTTSNCNVTSSGCGFLWAFECGYACA